jgi:predicted amidohydrolase YtcJ
MRWLKHLFLCVALLGCNGSDAVPETLDIILAGGAVYAGQDTKPVVVDIGIQGDRIVAIGNLEDRPADLRLEVGGLAVMPGIVDIHSHRV